MSISSPIIPAIIPQSFDDLVVQVQKLLGVPEVHIDVVDGIFVPSISWPYLGDPDVTRAHDVLAPFSLEVDLMVSKPLPAARNWLTAGADQLLFHIETISVETLKEFTDNCGITVGVALSNSTSLEVLYPYIPLVDYVQFMGIARIGSQGQQFDESVLERIRLFREKYPNVPVAIDGSVNQTTLPKLRSLGLSRLIIGSAIMGAENPKAAYLELTKYILE
jgi:ribulose-phosphate 3-epimerase